MKSWVTVKAFTDVASAQVVSDLLTGPGIPNPIHRPPASQCCGGECYLWVPPERAAEARTALEGSLISVDELTRLALASSPPDHAQEKT
ncbi:MAG: hypothetical protein JSR66_34085 [Proteobacteria bacterium]|nr:hypothetical protein [Pseudomonadota bacterium]